MDELISTEHDGRRVYRSKSGTLYSLPPAPKEEEAPPAEKQDGHSGEEQPT